VLETLAIGFGELLARANASFSEAKVKAEEYQALTKELAMIKEQLGEATLAKEQLEKQAHDFSFVRLRSNKNWSPFIKLSWKRTRSFTTRAKRTPLC